MAQDALEQLIGNPNVDEVKIVKFGGTATSTVWMSRADALVYVGNIANLASLGGGTNYDAALFHNGSGSNKGATFAFDTQPASGGDRYVFFLSDGEPSSTAEAIDAGQEATWITFLENNDIEKAVALGFGGLNATQANFLEPIAWEPRVPSEVAGTFTTAAADDNVIIIADSDLTELGDILEAELDTADGNVLDNDGFGADGGFIKSIVIDGVTYTFDGTDTITPSGPPPAGGVLVENGDTFIVVKTVLGGTFTFYFADTGGNDSGNWQYTPPASLPPGDDDESFHYTLVDGDGDEVSANLNIEVTIPGTPVVANDDTIITNITDFSPIDIPTAALLYNDTDVNGDPITISSVQSPAGGTVTKPSDVVFDPSTPPATIELVKTYTFAGQTAGAGPHLARYFEVDIDGNTPLASLTLDGTGSAGYANNTELTTTQYGQISAADDTRYATGDPGSSDNAVFWAQFDVTEPPASITKIDILIEARQDDSGDGSEGVDFGVWNYATNSWEAVSEIRDTSGADGNFTISINTNPANYVSPDGKVTVVLLNEDDNNAGGTNQRIQVDYVEIEVTSNQPIDQVGAIVDENFASGAGGFTYVDNHFGGTGTDANGTSDTGMLHIDLGGNDGDDEDDMNGAFTRTFNLAAAAMVTITFEYRVQLSAATDNNEDVEVRASIDGTVLGTSGLVGSLDGSNSGGAGDSGWQTFTTTVNLAAGNHTLALGGLFTNKEDADEFADIDFDNVQISADPFTFGNGSFDYTASDVDGSDDASVTVTAVAGSTITGTGNGEILIGGAGDDTLVALGGNDVLVGGGGLNKMTGGTGADLFIIEHLDAADLIADYDFETDGDKIDLSALLDANFDTGDDASLFVRVQDSGSGANLQVNVDGVGSDFVTVATLQNFDPATNAVKVLFEGDEHTVPVVP